MNLYVLDTSVTVAWYLDEDFSESAREWQSKMTNGLCTFYVPHLHYLEFSNVLRSLVMRKEITVPFAQKIYALHLLAPLKARQTEAAHVLETALNYESTTYDAAFIQLSLQFNIPLVTAEKRNRGWVQKLGNQILTIV